VILVVDDSPFTGEAIAFALNAAGFEVELARDLHDIERVREPPDLILMDVVLDEAYGDELATVLRTTRGFRCPILLMSALPEGELAHRVVDAKLDGYVAKHEGLRAIVAAVRRVLKGGSVAPVARLELASRFDLFAHQRLSRVDALMLRADLWDVRAIEAEMHGLAGDAELVGKTSIATAARICRDAAGQSELELVAAITDLARLLGALDRDSKN